MDNNVGCIWVFIAIIVWWFWTPSYDHDGLVTFVSRMKSEFGPAYFIEKNGFLGNWHKTVLVYGYLDDYTVCHDLINAEMAKDHRLKLRCVPAN